LKQPQFISTQAHWDRVALELEREPELAVDTEANSMYAYRGRICLVQIASVKSVWLLDPLAVGDLSHLGRILADSSIVKIMHGSDYDLRSFFREYGFPVNGLFDTETCARFLGLVSPNLAAVLQRFLDVEIPKSRRLQRSNWGLRPLSEEAVAYAAADVQHLIALADKERKLLTEWGRLAWVQEEFARLEATGRAVAELPPPDFLRVKGSDRLNPQQLAVLKELFDLREAEAERIDQPPYRVMGNDALLHLAQEPTMRLEDVPGLSPHLVRRLGDKMRAGIQKAMRGSGIQQPPRPRRTPPGREVQARQQKLKQWRSDKGADLALDPALLWPAASLERLAQDPASWESELADTGASGIRTWQRGEFAEELAAVLRSAA
jgi:ribonuclease D